MLNAIAELPRPECLEHEDDQRVAVLLDVPDELAALVDRLLSAPPRPSHCFLLERIGESFACTVLGNGKRLIELAPLVDRIVRDARCPAACGQRARPSERSQVALFLPF